MYYKGAHGIILTYDVTDENSFKNIHHWVTNIEQNTQSNVCKVLVGNKVDEEEARKVSYDEGAMLAKELNMQFFETSAKTNYNIKETFTYLANEILSTTDVKTTSNNIKIDNKSLKSDKEKKNGCF
jgi:GTPase SAR1 family protein